MCVPSQTGEGLLTGRKHEQYPELKELGVLPDGTEAAYPPPKGRGKQHRVLWQEKRHPTII